MQSLFGLNTRYSQILRQKQYNPKSQKQYKPNNKSHWKVQVGSLTPARRGRESQQMPPGVRLGGSCSRHYLDDRLTS